MNNNTKKQQKWIAIVKETIWLVILISFFFFVKSNTIELFKIPTGSMEPTLFGANEMGHGFGDHILVLRCAYGFTGKVKIPLVGWHLPIPDFRYMGLPGMRYPKVGDVVVFENPTDHRIDYIKRCAGTPGDHVKIKNGHLYVNDKIVTNSPATATYVHYTNAGLLCDKFVTVQQAVDNIIDKSLAKAAQTNSQLRSELLALASPAAKQNILYAIKKGGGLLAKRVMPIIKKYNLDKIKDSILINGKPYRKVEKLVERKSAGFDPITDTIVSEIVVPSNSYFMLGDNSAFSSDSRYWGFAPFDLIKGRAWCVYLPIKRIRMIR